MVRVDPLSDDVIAFLSEGTRTGMLGYLASDGRPLVAPVWFVVEGGELAFNTGKNTAKGRALARDRQRPGRVKLECRLFVFAFFPRSPRGVGFCPIKPASGRMAF